MSSGCPIVCPRAQERYAELDEAPPHGQVDAAGQRDATPVVAHDDLTVDAVAGDDPLMREREIHIVRARPEQERHARDQEQKRIRPATIHSTQPNEKPRASPIVAATATSAPAGRTVRDAHAHAAASPSPIARQTPPTTRRRARARARGAPR